MLRSTSTALLHTGKPPVPDPVKRQGHWAWNTHANRNWRKLFWEYTLNDTRRASFWVSDFKHRYLVRTGKEHRGQVPANIPAGMYPGMHPESLRTTLRDYQPADRETRRLPIVPQTARVVHEHYLELHNEFWQGVRRDRAIMREVREVELHQWYNKAQKVRGRWCRDQGIASRGVYSPAVDAAELWG